MDKEGVVYIHNGILLSHKPFAATWMDPEIIKLMKTEKQTVKSENGQKF